MTWSWRTWLSQLCAPAPLRPPGARPEAEFNSLCIRCGRCVAACSYRSLQPAGWEHGSSAGTPLVEARKVPCYLCMLCPPVCPTGALEEVADSRQVRMGVAEVPTSPPHRGILCRTCVDECPFEGDAIHQDGQLRPVVTDACVGCGICERVCPADPPAIRVRPHSGTHRSGS